MFVNGVTSLAWWQTYTLNTRNNNVVAFETLPVNRSPQLSGAVSKCCTLPLPRNVVIGRSSVPFFREADTLDIFCPDAERAVPNVSTKKIMPVNDEINSSTLKGTSGLVSRTLCSSLRPVPLFLKPTSMQQTRLRYQLQQQHNREICLSCIHPRAQDSQLWLVADTGFLQIGASLSIQDARP